MLISTLYKTNKSIISVVKELGIDYVEEDLGDLEQCSNCNIWYHSYELLPDLDDNNICKFCEDRYGR